MLKKISIVLLALSLFACSDANNPETKTSPATTVAAETTAVPDSHSPAVANTVKKYFEGTHYRRVKNTIETGSDKIVVTEFFWYGCPHCEHFEPVLEAWNKKKADDVLLQQSPAVWRDPMKLHAKVFFLVQALPDSALAHAAMFTEIIAMRDEADMAVQNRKIAEMLGKFGVSESAYNEKMQSPEIEAQLQSAIELMKNAGVSGTPTVMVNGKYVVNNESVTSIEQILEIADFLVEKERHAQ